MKQQTTNAIQKKYKCRYIPMRLTMAERKWLRLLEAALSVSEYTNRIDTPKLAASAPQRIARQCREIEGLLLGLTGNFFG